MPDEDGLTYGINTEGVSGDDALSLAIARGVAGGAPIPDEPDTVEPTDATSLLDDLEELPEAEDEPVTLADLMEMSEDEIEDWANSEVPEHARDDVANLLKQARKLGHGDKLLTQKSQRLSEAERRLQAKEAELEAKLAELTSKPASETPTSASSLQASYTAWYYDFQARHGREPSSDEQSDWATSRSAEIAAEKAIKIVEQRLAPMLETAKEQKAVEQWKYLFAKLPVVEAEIEKDERVGSAIAQRAQELGLTNKPNGLFVAAVDMFGDKVIEAQRVAKTTARAAQGARRSNQLPPSGSRPSGLPPQTTDIETLINHALNGIEGGRQPRSLPRRKR